MSLLAQTPPLKVETLAILHLEDSAVDGALVRDFLEADGLSVDIRRVWTREEFSQELEARRFDLILADHQLPSFDGDAALEIARRVAPTTPFIFVSGTLGEDVAVEALKRGATDYVVKQRMERLAGVVTRAFEEARERAQRRQAELALERSERELQLALHAGRFGTWSLDLQSGKLSTSALCREIFGRPADSVMNYDDFKRQVHPLDSARVNECIARCIETGEDCDIEYRIASPSRPVRWVGLRGQCVYGSQRRPARIVGVSLDIDKRKREEIWRAAINRLEAEFLAENDPARIAFLAAEMLGQTLEVSRAGYGSVDAKAETITIERDWNAEGIRSLAGTLQFRDYGSYVEDLMAGQTVVFADARVDPRTRAKAAALEAISALSVVNLPVVEGGETVALLYLNNVTARRWSEEELAFIREVAERTRTTVERRRAEQALRINEARLRFLDELARETARSVVADEILAITTRMTGEHLSVSVCAYADMDEDQDGFTIRGDWFATGSTSIVGHYSLADFGKLAVAKLSSGKPLIVHDNSKELPAGEAATFQNIGIAATICMPLVKQGRLTALMAIHDRRPRRWREDELALLTEITERSWAHIERVRSDNAARLVTERLDLATRAALIGTWDYDPVANILEWDVRTKQVFGLGPEAEVSYDTFLAGLHPDDCERTNEAVQRALSGAEAYDIEYRTVGLIDRIERWISAKGEAIFNDDRAVRFIGTVIDITERKRAEAGLRVLNDTGAALAKERDLETIVQTVTDAGVALSGAQFGAFFYNVLDPSGAGYMLYALSGAPKSAFERFPMPRSTAIFEPTFVGTGVVRSDDILQDPRYGKNAPRKGMPAGHLPVRSYLAVPVISRSGDVLGGLFFGHAETGRFNADHESALLGIAGHAATAIDNARLFQAVENELAERRRAEEALQTLNVTLEQRVSEEIAERSKAEEQLRQAEKMQAVGQLTGGIAHDFNNMLAVIMGGLTLVKRKLENGETDFSRFIDGAMEGAQRAATLTQRLLAFSRQQPLAPAALNLNRLVAGMSELLGRTLGETIRIETVLGAGLWNVRADPTQLESAILNLSVNARDAMPRGGRLTVETANASIDETYAKDYSLTPGQFVMIAISDTGTGMHADVVAKAFDPFFTTKSVGKGTGLGLSQVYGFVRQSGGNVKIYSEPGVGTTVKIYLPRHYGSSDAPIAHSGEKVSRGAATETILVVEDDDRVRSVSCATLRELGYSVLEAGSPSEAINIIRAAGSIALLFTDVVMPEMSGRELADAARRMRPNLKVLFTTGYTRNAIVHNGVLDSGMQLLTKPFRFEDLASKVRDILDGQ